MLKFLCVELVLLSLLINAQRGQRPGGGDNGGGECSDTPSQNACAADGSDYTYEEEIDRDVRRITMSHCPNHAYMDLNPNTAIEGTRSYVIPAYPMFIGTESTEYMALNEQGGAIGVLYDGAFIYSAYGGTRSGPLDMSVDNDYENSAPYVEGNTFDFCNEHASSDTRASYHTHVPPSCLLQQLGQTDNDHSPRIGWSLDGFPVYGPRGPNGVMMMQCTESNADPNFCVDKCGGFYDDGTIVGDGFVYRYYIMGYYNEEPTCSFDLWSNLPGEEVNCDYSVAQFYPFTPLCLRGCCPDGIDCFDNDFPSCSSINSVVSGTTPEYDPESTVTTALEPYTAVSECNCEEHFPTQCVNYQIGDPCSSTTDCADDLICMANVCTSSFMSSTNGPTPKPTYKPTLIPSSMPTLTPTRKPTLEPSQKPTRQSTSVPTPKLTPIPSTFDLVAEPTQKPTSIPTSTPTRQRAEPTLAPASEPVTDIEATSNPSLVPTQVPTTQEPTCNPTSISKSTISGSIILDGISTNDITRTTEYTIVGAIATIADVDDSSVSISFLNYRRHLLSGISIEYFIEASEDRISTIISKLEAVTPSGFDETLQNEAADSGLDFSTVSTIEFIAPVHTSEPTFAPASNSADKGSSSKNNVSNVMFVAIIFCVIAALLCIAGSFLFCCWYRRAHIKNKEPIENNSVPKRLQQEDIEQDQLGRERDLLSGKDVGFVGVNSHPQYKL